MRVRFPGLLICVLMASACTRRAEMPRPAVVAATPQAPLTPALIELSGAKAKLIEPELVEFEVKYRFAEGQPQQTYACEITFPGTPNHGIRKMEGWELKSEGMIRDRVTLSKGGAKSFAIHMSEAPSRRDAYKKISNVVTGSID
jgi:hypothetical protein